MITPKNRLPMSHPDYSYPPSRNPYWFKNKDLAGLIYTDNDTEKHRGHWRSQFPKADPKRLLHVEVGCSAGHVVTEWARLNPQDAYIGLDWKHKMIHRCAEKAVKKELRNALFFRAHAERLHFMFGLGEIDRLYLFFPDPWSKKSQWKNRSINTESLKLLAPLMSERGIFHIKTDHDGYFDWMLEAIEASGCWETIECTRDLHKDHPDPRSLKIPEVTLFEGLFIKDGIKIKSIKLRAKR